MKMNDNNVPVYLQVINLIKINIISGIYKPGARLLSVREFALLLMVNPNTMQKALAELENMKLIYTDRTNGKYVTDNSELIEEIKKNYANDLAIQYLDNMKQIGFTTKQAIECLHNKKGEK